MTSEDSSSGSPGPVIHVLPVDIDRGAQRYARALVDELDSPQWRHLILTLFREQPTVLHAELRLDVPQGILRRLGFDPRVTLALRAVLERHEPSVVVSHGGEPAKYLVSALPESTPLVYLAIGSSHPRLRRPLSRRLHRRYLERADAVVAVSKQLAQEMIDRHRVPGHKMHVIPNGRDPARFRPAHSSAGRSDLRLIWIGRLEEGKRPDWFCHVVGALREEGIQVVAAMVGEGPLLAEIRPLAESAGVSLLGRRDDVATLLSESDVLVMTSRPPEGMPGVLIEAGLSGLPVVTTRIPGASEVVEDGVTGYVVDLDDMSGLVASLRRLIDAPQLRREMGEAARRRCVDHFSLPVTADRWRRLLGELAGVGYAR